MNEEKFFQQLQLLYERVGTLQKNTSRVPWEQQEWLPVALAELNTAFEELQVAEEELRVQTEALSSARQTIEAERQRYQDLFEEAPDGYIVTDAQGKIQEANSVAAKLLNIKRQFLLGKPLINFIVESERGNFRTQLNQLWQGDQASEWEVRLQPRISPGKNLRAFDAAMTVSAIRNREGTLVALRWLIRDVTEHKQILERLRLLESVVVNGNDAVLITEAEPLDEPGPRILYANAAFTRMTGYGQEEVLGLTPRILQGPLTDQSELAKIKASLKKFAPVIAEVLNYRKDGTVFWVEMSMMPVADETGCYTHWVSVQRDVTERRRAEAARAQLLYEQAARAEAETSNRMKDEFLAMVSHELRSPLNAILGWARLLQARKFDAAKTNQALSIIERNAQAQTQLIEDLLDISRIIRGQVRLYTRPIKLRQVIEAAIDTVRHTADTKMIQVEPNLDCVGLVNGDPDRLQQVFCNLLSNAIKFTPNGGRVEVLLKSINSHAQIQVIDTGIGISPDFLPQIFERFRQAESKTTRAHSGLGLGLAIVRYLVELHGGTIRAESQGLGQGATFIVQLPLSTHGPKVSEPELIPIQRQNLLEDSLSLSGLRVLIVDDEIDTREFLVTALEQVGAQVMAAASVGEAMQQLERFSPDVLLSDIGMPEEDGYSLIKKIRALAPKQGGQIKAVALTAFTREEDRIQALQAGFQMHVPKPIEPKQLVAVIAQLAGRSS